MDYVICTETSSYKYSKSKFFEYFRQDKNKRIMMLSFDVQYSIVYRGRRQTINIQYIYNTPVATCIERDALNEGR